MSNWIQRLREFSLFNDSVTMREGIPATSETEKLRAIPEREREIPGILTNEGTKVRLYAMNSTAITERF